MTYDIKDCFASLEKQNETVAMLKDTDIIFGCDNTTGNAFLVYGRELLKSITEDGVARSCSTVIINLRQATIELEMLLAAVLVAKGHEEYQSDEEARDIKELERMFGLTEGSHRMDGTK